MSIIAGKALDHPKVQLQFRKHFLPPVLGILVGASVFVSMNMGLITSKAELFAAQHKPLSSNTLPPPSAAPASDNSDNASSPFKAPSQDPRIVISRLGVDAPVVYGETSTVEWKFQNALKHGTVHYPGTALPGSKGNVSIFGHSSGYSWAEGDYKFVFTQLNKLKNGDTIIMDYKGTRYTYVMSGRRIVEPTDVWILDQDTDHDLTLVTCTPVGSDKQRLVIEARQISPTKTY